MNHAPESFVDQPNPMFGRNFLKEIDVTRDDVTYLLDLAEALKSAKKAGREYRNLTGKNIALIFEKTSTRTRCAFEVAAADQGASSTFLDPSSSQIGHKESTADTARVLGRFYDGIEFRGKAQSTVEELAEYAGVPVYNGLTDEWHPTQMLADFLTMREHSTAKTPLSFAYLGDGRSNMGRSLLIMGALMGVDVRIAAPAELQPERDVISLARSIAEWSGARMLVTDDPDSALAGADFVHTDVWVSMGEPESAWEERIDLLRPFRVDERAMSKARPGAKFMHCLPAYHDMNTVVGQRAASLTGLTDGIEVSSAVFDSPANICFDQAENRLHTIKAVLVSTLTENPQPAVS